MLTTRHILTCGIATLLLSTGAHAQTLQAQPSSEGDMQLQGAVPIAESTDLGAKVEADTGGEIEDGETAQSFDQVLRPINFGNEYLSVTGYIQPSFTWTEDTNAFGRSDFDSFSFGQARIGFQASYPIHEMVEVGIKAELGFDQGSSKFSPRDMHGTLGFFDGRLKFDFGQQRVSYSLTRQTSARFQQLADPDSSQPDFNRLVPSREPGIRLRFETPFAEKGLFRIHASMSNGDGQNQFTNDEDSTFRYATFVDVAPIGDPGWAPTDLDNSDFVFSVGGSAAYSAEVGPDNPGVTFAGSERRLAGHGRLKFRGFSLRGEYFHITRDVPSVEDDTFSRGGIVQAGYVLPVIDFPQIELAVGYQRFDLDSTANGFEGFDAPTAYGALQLEQMETQIIEAGVNLYLFEHRTKLSITYRYTDVIDDEVVVDAERVEFPETVVGNRIFVVMQFGAF